MSQFHFVCVQKAEFVEINLSFIIKIDETINKSNVFIFELNAQHLQPSNDLIET